MTRARLSPVDLARVLERWTLADQSQQTAARVMVLLVRREVLGQLIDPGRE